MFCEIGLLPFDKRQTIWKCYKKKMRLAMAGCIFFYRLIRISFLLADHGLYNNGSSCHYSDDFSSKADVQT